MARPIKSGLSYFPLDTDFFGNDTINALRRAHGSVGVLVYLNLLCHIYHEGYYIKFKSLDELSMDIAEEITNVQLKRTATQVAETINYLVGQGTLNEALFKRGIISGEKIQEQYVCVAYKLKRNIRLDVHALVDVCDCIRKFKVNSKKTVVNSEETAVNSEFGTQNKSKSKNTTTTIVSISGAQVRTCACEGEDEARDGPPDVVEVAALFDREYGMRRIEALEEAHRFYDYNEARGWDCLPYWRVAAVRWRDQKIKREVEEDSR